VFCEGDAGKADDEEGCGSEWADGESGGHLSEESGLGDMDGRDAENSGGVGDDWQDAEVEGVWVEEQAERHGADSHDKGNMRCAMLRDVLDGCCGHGFEHSGAFEDASESSGGEENTGHHECGGSVGGDAHLLGFERGEVQEEREHGSEHEEEDGVDFAGDGV